MKKLLLVTTIGLCAFTALGQVGINNTSPNATLDISASSSPTNTNGILIPQIDDYPSPAPGAAQDGMMVFVTGAGTPAKGFYYWNNTAASWVAVAGADNDWTEVGADVERQSGDVYIGNTSGTNNNLYISNQLVDWDDNSFFVDPAAQSNLDEINFSSGTDSDPGIHFGADTNTGFYRPETDAIGFTADGIDKIRFTSRGQIEMFNSGNSVYIGSQAGNVDDLSNNQNVGIGNSSLLSNTTGSANAAVGYLSLRSNQTGASNVGLGYGALFSNTSGNFNVAAGRSALGSNTDGAQNIGIGNQALFDNLSGDNNIALGHQSLADNLSDRNIAIGYTAGNRITTGTRNIGIGYRAQAFHTNGNDNITIGDASMDSMNSTTNASNNVAIGSNTMSNLTEGSNNVAIGQYALYGNGNGAPNFANENVAIGAGAGQNAEGDGNVYIGYQAGRSNPFSNNTLFIENSNADEDGALIYGEFDNDILRVNGEIQVSDPSVSGYGLPTADGSASQVLTTDGNGNVTWETPTSPNLFSLTKVHLSSNQTYSGSGQDIMDLDNVAIDLNSDFDTSTNRFVASQAGYYRITANYHSTNNTTTDRFGLSIWINNTFAKYNLYDHQGSGTINRHVEHITQLAVGDYIDLRIFGDSSFTINSNIGYTSFEIERIR